MRKSTTQEYEEKVTTILNAEIEKISGELNTFIKQAADNQYIYIAEEIKPYFLDKIENLDFPRFNSTPPTGYSVASCIYAYTPTDNGEFAKLRTFEFSSNLISVANFSYYLQDNQGASTFGEYLKLLLTSYKMTMGKPLDRYFRLINETDYSGDDNAKFSSDGHYPKRNLLKRIVYIVLTSDNETEEEQILSFKLAKTSFLLSKYNKYQPEYLCKLLGIECLSVIKTGEYRYSIYFKSNKGFHHLKFNGDEYSTFNYQAPSRAWSDVKHHSKIFFAGKNDEIEYVDDIELSDNGLLMLEMLHIGDITKIYPAQKRTFMEKLKYHLTGRNFTRRYGKFLLITTGYILVPILTLIIRAMI